MSKGDFNRWQDVQAEVLSRLNNRVWKPGELIPNEADLATEFGCARATVNRALRNLAESGLLDRRRRAGTRVATHPVRRATLDIAVLRDEIEATGAAYRYQLIRQEKATLPADLARLMKTEAPALLHVEAVHYADDSAYVFEDRWINEANVPAVQGVDFSDRSPNQWLVETIPFTGGDIAFSARSADKATAAALRCANGTGVFIIDRRTWNDLGIITAVRLSFAPGYQVRTEF